MSEHRPSRPAVAWWRRRLAVLLAPCLLAACAGGGVVPPPPAASLFDDARFAAAAEPLSPDDVLRLTPAMAEYLRRDLLPAVHRVGARRALTQDLYAARGLQLEYESSMTRNAGEAFDAREGNCLSLVLMTAAFAKALELSVNYQQVAVDEMWSRAGGLYFTSGHVNLQIVTPMYREAVRFDRAGVWTIDFLPPEESTGLRVRPIDEATILAMYFNNRAAEAMVRGRLDDAYWRVRTALRLAPNFLSAWNTLGVIYLRHGDAAQAAAVFDFARARAPDNAQMLANAADALHVLGREPEAAALRIRLARLEPTAPFALFEQGRAAYRAGDLATARELFRKELRRDPDYHEFHFWLAVTDFGLGRVDEARSEMTLALADAVQRSDHDLYAAKLDRLNAYRAAARAAPPPAHELQ